MRGRRRQGRGRGGGLGQQMQGGTTMAVFQDSEVLGGPSKGQLYALEFTPGGVKSSPTNKTALEATRLNYEAAKYSRFKIRYVNISFKATSPTTAKGNVSLGILAGPVNAAIKTSADILKLRPYRCTPSWKTVSISVGREIQSQLSYLTNKPGDADGVPFTIYIQSDSDSDPAGVLELSYLVEFSFPHP